MSSTSDSHSSTNMSLLVRVKDPENHDAWARFDAKYRPLIVEFCRTHLRMSDEAADEAAQVVLVKLVHNMRQFEYDPKHSFRAWLKRVTNNSVIDGMRRTKPDRGVGGSEMIDRLHQVSDASTEQRQLIDHLSFELRQTLFDECETLVQARVAPQTWQAFLLLRQGEKAADAAAELGMTVAAVYRAKTRVLKIFREEVTLKLKADRE